MNPDRMRLAAEHLRLNAQCLFESCTINGQWDGEHPDEQQDCEEMVVLADELEHATDCLPNASDHRTSEARSAESPCSIPNDKQEKKP